MVMIIAMQHQAAPKAVYHEMQTMTAARVGVKKKKASGATAWYIQQPKAMMVVDELRSVITFTTSSLNSAHCDSSYSKEKYFCLKLHNKAI